MPRLSRRVSRATGIPLAWYDVLHELSTEPGVGLRIAELGERVVLSRSRVSRIVDELVNEGLVARDQDPTDGRASLVRLTESGNEAFHRARPVYLDAIDELFGDPMSPEEQQTVAEALERVLDCAKAPPRQT